MVSADVPHGFSYVKRHRGTAKRQRTPCCDWRPCKRERGHLLRAGLARQLYPAWRPSMDDCHTHWSHPGGLVPPAARNGRRRSPANGPTSFQSLRRWSACSCQSRCRVTQNCQTRRRTRAKSAQSREIPTLRHRLASPLSRSQGSQGTQRSSQTSQASQSRQQQLEVDLA